jgi:uncharacterized membrane protein YqjE
MKGRLRSWRDLLRSLGTAVLELLEAEVAALGRELAANGKHLRRGALLLVLGLGVTVAALWGFALLLFELLVLVLPRWGAAATILGVEVVAALALVWAGRRALRRMENPRALVARRTREHVEWWQKLLGGEEPGTGGVDDQE